MVELQIVEIYQSILQSYFLTVSSSEQYLPLQTFQRQEKKGGHELQFELHDSSLLLLLLLLLFLLLLLLFYAKALVDFSILFSIVRTHINK
jgi:flagellar biosynthesis protein FliP